LPRGQEDFTLKMGDKQKECSLCNILASFSGGNDQDDESSSEISSSSDDSSDDENSVKEVKERRSKQRSKQMKKTSGKVKSTPAVNKNGKTGSAAKQQLSDVKDGQSGAQPLDDQAEDSNQIEKPKKKKETHTFEKMALTDFQKKLAKKTDNGKTTGGFKIKKYGTNGKAKACLLYCDESEACQLLKWEPVRGSGRQGRTDDWKVDFAEVGEVRAGTDPDPEFPRYAGTPTLRRVCPPSHANKVNASSQTNIYIYKLCWDSTYNMVQSLPVFNKH